MLEAVWKDKVAVLDLRERIGRGEHPRREVLEFVREAEKGTVVMIDLPHRAEPLVAGLADMGIAAVVNELEPGHYRLMCVKL